MQNLEKNVHSPGKLYLTMPRKHCTGYGMRMATRVSISFLCHLFVSCMCCTRGQELTLYAIAPLTEEISELELSKIIDKGGSGKIQAGKRKEKSSKKKRIDGNESSSDEEVGKVAAKKARTSSKKKIFDDEDDEEDDKMDEDSDSGKKKKKEAKKNAMDMLMTSKSGRKTKKVTYADSGSDDDDLMDSDEEVVHKKKKAAKKSNGKAAKGKKSTSNGKKKKGKGGSDSEDEFKLGSEPEDEDESFAADSESEMEIDSEEEAPKKKKKGDKKAAAAKKPASKKAADKKESAKEKKAAGKGKGKKAAPDSIEALCAAKEKDINLLNNPQKFPEDGPYVEPVGIDATDGIVEGIIGGMVQKVGKLLLGTLKREDSERELGELNFPIKLNTACSGTDAPSIALGLVKESLDRFCSQATDEDGNGDKKEGQGFEYEHNMSCEIEPFKQAYIGRNFPGVLLFPDITKLTEKETVVDVYGRAQTIPESE